MPDEEQLDDTKPKPATTDDVVKAIGELGSALKSHKGKDRWDKFSSLSTFLSSVMIAALGWYFTDTYRTAEAERARIQQERQNQLNELEVIVKFMPYLTGDDDEAKKTAITSIRALAGVKAATVMAELHPSVGAVLALKAIAATPTITSDERKRLQNAAQHIEDNLPRQQVLFSTDRKPSEDNPGEFTSERGELSFGIATVSLPLTHTIGEIESPQFYELDADPEKHTVVRYVDLMDVEKFINLLGSHVRQSPDRHLLVFVHGFNADFSDATLRLAQIAHDVKFSGVPMLYSWPSEGRIHAYARDQANIDYAKAHFVTLMRALKEISGAQRISIIAHGLGCDLVSRALSEIAAESDVPIVDQLILAASDIDREFFREQIAPRLTQAVNRTTLYVSRDDISLLASKKVHGQPRLGDAAAGVAVIAGIDSVLTESTDLIGHSYYVDQNDVVSDMRMVLDGKRASERMLQEQSSPDGSYWKLR